MLPEESPPQVHSHPRPQGPKRRLQRGSPPGMAVTLHCFEDEKAGRQVVRIALPPSAVYTAVGLLTWRDTPQGAGGGVQGAVKGSRISPCAVDAVAAGVASVGLSARVRVPDFIKAGDSVLVSIVSGEYKEKQ